MIGFRPEVTTLVVAHERSVGDAILVVTPDRDDSRFKAIAITTMNTPKCTLWFVVVLTVAVMARTAKPMASAL